VIGESNSEIWAGEVVSRTAWWMRADDMGGIMSTKLPRTEDPAQTMENSTITASPQNPEGFKSLLADYLHATRGIHFNIVSIFQKQYQAFRPQR
jgi:hypothetical protein